MLKKLVIIFISLGVIFATVYFYAQKVQKLSGNETGLSTPLQKLAPKSELELLKEKSVFFGKKTLNVLLIGTDTGMGRRSRGQLGFNTDVMILVSVNPEKNKVLFTSIPRDLWINDNKINALYIVYGKDTLIDAFQQVTGLTIDGTITVDFDGFKWIADAFGGIPVEIKNSFTDGNFPNNQDSDITTVSFTEGTENMNGERALTYARSRKGNNGEGSDLMRAKRQHLILEGMVKAISQPNSMFWPMDITGFYTTITQHVETSLKLEDIYYLWDFYKDRDKYKFESFVIGSDYIYHPGMYPDSPYHAWVFVPINDSFEKLHLDIQNKLNDTEPKPIESGSGINSGSSQL
jgi:LCP family protein required for cell wall assembly